MEYELAPETNSKCNGVAYPDPTAWPTTMLYILRMKEIRHGLSTSLDICVDYVGIC